MVNILLINDHIKDYELIINACNENTYPIKYNKTTDTYNSLFEKFKNLLNNPDNNIQIINHVAIVDHGQPNSYDFIFLEKEKNMILHKLIKNNNEITNVRKEIEICDNEINNLLEYIYQDISFSDVSYNIKKMLIYPELTPNELQIDEMININNKLNDFKLRLSDNPSYLKIKDLKQKIIDLLYKQSSILKIENNLETWGDFKTFIKKFNIQKSLDFLGCAILQSENWKHCLNTLETEEHLNINIRSSDDNTGNLKVGGDWLLESDNINIKDLYFTNDIGKWLYTLNDTYFTVNNNGGNSSTINSGNITIHNYDVEGRTGSIGELTINKTGIYEIIARGACGGQTGDSSSRQIRGGYGAVVSDEFELEAGTKLYFLIGKRGTSANANHNNGWGSGGGGGTFVITKDPSPSPTYTDDDIYIIAGGGGGSIFAYHNTTNQYLYGGNANNIRDASPGIPGEIGRHGGNPIVDMRGGNAPQSHEGVEADLKYGNAYGIYNRSGSHYNNRKPNQFGKLDYVDYYVNRPYNPPRKMRNPFFQNLGGINGYGGGGGGCAGGAGFFGNGSIGSQLNYTSINPRWALGFQNNGNHAGYACVSLNQNGVGGYGGGGHGANGGSGYGGGGGGYSGGAGGTWHHGRGAFWGVNDTAEQVWNAALANPNNKTSAAYTVGDYSTNNLYNSAGGAGSSFYNSSLSMGKGRFRSDLQNSLTDNYGGQLKINFLGSNYTVNISNIKFSDLYKDLIDDTWTINKSISLSEFRGIGPVPTTGEISIETHFKGQTFRFSRNLIYILQFLASKLNNLNNLDIQSTIISAGFTIFAKVKNSYFAENLQGISVSVDSFPYAFPNSIYKFAYSTNGLGSGENLVKQKISSDVTEKRHFMAMAIYSDYSDGTNNNFEGILVWTFKASSIGGKKRDGTDMSITNIASLFYNTGFNGNLQFWSVYPYFISNTGNIVTGNESGWRYSNNQQATTNGYYSISKFSRDDGVWGIQFGSNVDGNSPGPNFSDNSETYGIINYNAGDSNDCQIAGSHKPNFKAYIFYSSSPLPELYHFTSHTFTSCGVTGQNGPTLDQCKTFTEYASASWTSNPDFFNMNNNDGIQIWTVPKTGMYRIIAQGAKGGHGGDANTKLGGLGAHLEGSFNLTQGDEIFILVGQKGQEYGDGLSKTSSAGGGGGGGTFVLKGSDNNLSSTLIIAGGGAGSNHHGNKSANASDDINARLPNDTNTGGGDHDNHYMSGGGGGLITSGDGSAGSPNSGGRSFVDGGNGGIGGYGSNHATYRNYGGFGGGGGNGAHSGGGGGGINGGNARFYNDWKGGIGGASYNTGLFPSRPTHHTNDHGEVIIKLLI